MPSCSRQCIAKSWRSCSPERVSSVFSSGSMLLAETSQLVSILVQWTWFKCICNVGPSSSIVHLILDAAVQSGGWYHKIPAGKWFRTLPPKFLRPWKVSILYSVKPDFGALSCKGKGLNEGTGASVHATQAARTVGTGCFQPNRVGC